MLAQDSLSIAGQVRALSRGIAEYLAAYLADRQGFGMRSFYGEAFTLALLSRSGCLEEATEERLARAFAAKDRGDSQYHWEFNHYGMLEAGLLRPPLKFKHTPCTNWTLLRSTVRIRTGVDAVEGLHEALARLRRFQLRSGLILDDPGVRSFQYHCFSAAMIFEMHRETRDVRLLESFRRAVGFIRNFILPNGDTLYVGRGQQQSFGYASLLYILSAAYALEPDAELLDHLQRVLRHVTWHARYDGSLPLVLGGGAEPLPHPDAPHRDARYPGWYAYNNYFDYLPFAGLFLSKAADLLESALPMRPGVARQRPYRDADFVKVVVRNTVAVLARSGGYWSNDLPVPYVYCDGRARTGCYGGEQFSAGIYSLRGVPLPISGTRSIRRRAWSFFLGMTLVVLSPAGVLLRGFEVCERRIAIRTRVLSFLRFRDRYLFPADGPVIRSQHPLSEAGLEYSASGTLRAFEAARIGEVVLEFPE